MIHANEIRETAREHGVPVTTIEKDYCISWILNSDRWEKWVNFQWESSGQDFCFGFKHCGFTYGTDGF